MMTKKKTPVSRRIKFVWTLPVLALLLFAFAEPNYRVEGQVSDPGTSIREFSNTKTVKIAGLVLNENNTPMPGTAVLVEGSAVGTVTNMQGKFELEIPEDASIVLSFVGKKTIKETYSGILSGNKKDGVYYRKYKMTDVVVPIYNRSYSYEQMVPPPPPPPKSEKIDSEQTPPPPPPPAKGEKEVFYIVEDMPKYPGGYEALMEYVSKMQKKIAIQKKAKGKATINFTIATSGKVTDIKVVEQDNDGAAKGAYILAKEMSDWKPGKQRGKAVSVKYLLPVEFK